MECLALNEEASIIRDYGVCITDCDLKVNTLVLTIRSALSVYFKKAKRFQNIFPKLFLKYQPDICPV